MSVQSQIDRINQNVANTYAVLDALGADMPAEQNSDNLATTAGSAKAVLYSEQTLTEDQKAQARTNIDAVATDELQHGINDALAQAKASGEFDGAAGTSVTVKSVSESTADGGSNVVTFSDGKTITIKNGSKGSTGADGKTPVKGTDYFTNADKTEIAKQAAGLVEISDTYVVQDTAPEDTSVLWVDTSDDSNDGFQEAVNMALAQAKASGEFDGKDGQDGQDGYTPVKGVDYFDGKDGTNGKTPVKGTDYFTAADKTEMVNAVIAALPVYAGEVV